MSLKNEAQSAFQSTKSFYREYVQGMNRERVGRELQADSERLKQLYEEAIHSGDNQEQKRHLPFHVKLLRLFSALGQRLNPTRRLIFGISILSFAIYSVSNGILIPNLLLIVAFGGILMLLLVELLEKSDVKREIDLAREIQLGLLPKADLSYGSLDIYSFANTAQEVGGDYVDTIETKDGLYVVIADVSGKGLSAALYMVRMQALVNLIIEKSHPTPKELFLQLNNYVKSGIKDKTFVTACVAYFPKDESSFTLARAGHNAPIFYSKRKNQTKPLRYKGFALGMTTTSKMESFLTEKKVSFESGDSVLLYTDGLIEARNPQREEYGIERLSALLDVYGGTNPKTITRKIQQSVEVFMNGQQPHDDVTFTCVHRQ
jgi:serine phosphatase RsbU (regulator of sigma subunit)